MALLPDSLAQRPRKKLRVSDNPMSSESELSASPRVQRAWGRKEEKRRESRNASSSTHCVSMDLGQE